MKQMKLNFFRFVNDFNGKKSSMFKLQFCFVFKLLSKYISRMCNIYAEMINFMLTLCQTYQKGERKLFSFAQKSIENSKYFLKSDIA